MTDQDTDQDNDQDNDQVNGKLGWDLDHKPIEQKKISVSQWFDFMEIIIGNGSFNLTFKNEQECLHYNEILDEETVPDTWEEGGAWSLYLKRSECEPVSTRVSVSTSSSIR